MKKQAKFWQNRFNLKKIASFGTVGLVACLVVLLVLSWLFQEVWEKESFQFDTTLLLWIHQWSNPWLDRLMMGVTRLGNPEIVVGVVVGTLFWLWRSRLYSALTLFAIACLGALILNQELKLLFAKPRPQLWSSQIVETTFSFPSGHALGSLVLYGFIGYLLAHQFPEIAGWSYAIAVFLIAGIGFSRLYLGVHWPTDVIAGYGIGFLWLTICIALLQGRAR
jgi:membrane-associated phospholipid phosphatase